MWPWRTDEQPPADQIAWLRVFDDPNLSRRRVDRLAKRAIRFASDDALTEIALRPGISRRTLIRLTKADAPQAVARAIHVLWARYGDDPVERYIETVAWHAEHRKESSCRIWIAAAACYPSEPASPELLDFIARDTLNMSLRGPRPRPLPASALRRGYTAGRRATNNRSTTPVLHIAQHPDTTPATLAFLAETAWPILNYNRDMDRLTASFPRKMGLGNRPTRGSVDGCRPEELLAAVMGHPNCPVDLLIRGCHDTDPEIRAAAAANRNTPESDAVVAALLT